MTPLNTPLRIETQGYRHVVYDNLDNRIADFELYAPQQKQLFLELIRRADLHDELVQYVEATKDSVSEDFYDDIKTKLTNEEG